MRGEVYEIRLSEGKACFFGHGSTTITCQLYHSFLITVSTTTTIDGLIKSRVKIISFVAVNTKATNSQAVHNMKTFKHLKH